MRKISMKRRNRVSKADPKDDKEDQEESTNGDVSTKGKKRSSKAAAAEENGKDADYSDDSASEKSDVEEPETKKKKASKKGKEKDDDAVDEKKEDKKKKSGKKNADINKNDDDDADHDKKEDKKKKAGKKNAETKNDKVEEEDESEEEEYEVEAIVGDKKVRKSVHYLIRWKGYSSDQDTWEPERTLNCTDILKKYKEEKAKKRQEEEDEEEDDEKEYEVDRILEVHFKKDGKREFLVCWKGYSSTDSTWEPEENMDCSDLIAKFMSKVEKAKTVDQKNLRIYRAPTERFTLMPKDTGRRLSKRNSNKQRVRYADCE